MRKLRLSRNNLYKTTFGWLALRKEITDWLTEKDIRPIMSESEEGKEFYLNFDSENHAMLFKLTWG